MAANGTCFVPSLVGTLVIRAGAGCLCLLTTCCCSRKAKVCFQPDCPVYAEASRCFKSSAGYCRKLIGFIRDKGSFFCFLAERNLTSGSFCSMARDYITVHAGMAFIVNLSGG